MTYHKPALSFIAVTVLSAGLALSPAAFAAKEAPPEVSKDGLHLYKQTKERLAYVRPGATFTQYKKVTLLDCYVEFSKDWVNNYNRDQRDPSRQIRDSDLERAKTALQKDFKRIFTEELQAIPSRGLRRPGRPYPAARADQHPGQRSGSHDRRTQRDIRRVSRCHDYLSRAVGFGVEHDPRARHRRTSGPKLVRTALKQRHQPRSGGAHDAQVGRRTAEPARPRSRQGRRELKPLREIRRGSRPISRFALPRCSRKSRFRAIVLAIARARLRVLARHNR